MHTSVLLPLAFFALFTVILAAPTDNHPHLERRFVNPLTIGLGAGAVHKAKDNEKTIAEFHADLDDIARQVAALKATEATLHNAFVPQLKRRQLGTILGAVGIHKSKHNRQDIDQMNHMTMSLRQDVDILLREEQLGPNGSAEPHFEDGGPDHFDESGGPDLDESGTGGDQHRLVRRQLGIILSPIALHKSRKDRKMLEELRPQIQALRFDCGRIKTAQDARLMVLRRGPIMRNMPTTVSIDLVSTNGGGRNGGVLSANDFRGPAHVRGPTVYDDGHHDTYGAPRY